MIYESKRNGLQAELISQDDKFKTVAMKYIAGDKQGQEFSATISTFKRWWKRCEIKEELEIEVPKINPNDVKIVESTDDKVNSVVDVKQSKENMLDYVISVLPTNCIYKSTPRCITIYNDSNKRLAYVWKRKTCVRLYVPESIFSTFSEGLQELIYNIKEESKTEKSFYVEKANIDAIINFIYKE